MDTGSSGGIKPDGRSIFYEKCFENIPVVILTTIFRELNIIE